MLPTIRRLRIQKWIVKVDPESILLEYTRQDDAKLVRAANLSVEEFRRLLRKRREYRVMQLFPFAQIIIRKSKRKIWLSIPHPKLNRVFHKYGNVFQGEIFPQFRQKWSVAMKFRFKGI